MLLTLTKLSVLVMLLENTLYESQNTVHPVPEYLQRIVLLNTKYWPLIWYCCHYKPSPEMYVMTNHIFTRDVRHDKPHLHPRYTSWQTTSAPEMYRHVHIAATPIKVITNQQDKSRSSEIVNRCWIQGDREYKHTYVGSQGTFNRKKRVIPWIAKYAHNERNKHELCEIINSRIIPV